MAYLGVFSLGAILGYFFFWLRMKFKEFLALNYRKIKSTKHFKEIQIKSEEKDKPLTSLSHFHFRPNTHDERIFDCVNKHNEYRLPNEFEQTDVVIDIGAHIGSFSYACLSRGAGKVYAYEAFSDNYKLAAKNLRRFNKRLSINQFAVWRSDKRGEVLHFAQSTDTENTGGGNVWASSKGVEVQTISLDEILSTTKGSVTLLKLDCEGSEFPILFTSKLLGKVNAICGEYHEMGGEYDKNEIPKQTRVDGYDKFTADELTKFLDKQGFDVTCTRSLNADGTMSSLGLFFAERRL